MYEKTEWVAGGAPGISAQKLNKIEQGIYESSLVNSNTLTNGVLNGLNVEFATASAANVDGGNVYIDDNYLYVAQTGVDVDPENTGSPQNGYISVNNLGDVVFTLTIEYNNILLAEIIPDGFTYTVKQRKQVATTKLSVYRQVNFGDGELIEFSNGYTILNFKENLGSVISQGSGTYSDPYRTISKNVDLNDFNVDFSGVPNVQITPETTGVPVVARNISVSFDNVENNVISDIRAFRNSSDATGADVTANIRVEGMSDRLPILLG
jgi:hypothetical protein